MRNVIKAVFLTGWRLIIAYFTWIRKYSKPNNNYPIKERYQKLHEIAKITLKNLDGEVIVKGKENIPHEISCFLSNHLNASDPLVYISILEDPIAFVCKKEVQDIPYVNKCVNVIDGVFIDRENLKASLKTMMKVEEDLSKRSKNWLIFPEGTRNKDSRHLCLPFHYGTFRAPTRAGVPLVPCAIYGTQRLLPGHKHFKKYPIYVEFGKPLYPSEYKDMSNEEIANTIQSRVQQMISYNARKVDKENIVRILGKKYNENL